MPTKQVTSDLLIKELDRLGYNFRLNTMDDSLEVMPEVYITDFIKDTIRTEMRDKGYSRYLTAIEEAYRAKAYKNSFHPIREKLESLQWDGLPHIHLLSNYFTETPNQHNTTQKTIFELFFNRWFIGCIAKALDCKQNIMFVIDGPQDIGKSSFVRWLSSIFPPQFFIEGSINPSNKDDELRLMKTIIWEVAEFGSTARKADREALKHFISTKTLTVRKPYGYYDITKPALSSLIGTINNEAGFLTDPTGNRRFLVSTILNIDWEGYTKNIDREQLWAEAVAKYKTGVETERLTDEEKKIQTNINENYMIDDPFIIGLQQKCLANPDDTSSASWHSSNEILIYLGYDPPNRGNAMALGSAAKKLGLIKGKGGVNGKINGYFGIYIP